jgi:hypothetical protein
MQASFGFSPDVFKRHIEGFGYGLLNSAAFGPPSKKMADGRIFETETSGNLPVPDPVRGKQAPDVIQAACIFWQVKVNFVCHRGDTDNFICHCQLLFLATTLSPFSQWRNSLNMPYLNIFFKFFISNNP